MSFSFGLPTTTATLTQVAAQPGLSAVAFTKTPSKTSFSLTPAKAAAGATKTDSPKVTFTLPASTMATTGLNFSMPTTTAGGIPKTEVHKVGFSLVTSSATTATSGFTLPTPTPTTSVAAELPSSSVSLNYNQVEDLLNKWTTELAEQEALFHEQIRQVNGWDRILCDNSSKLAKLHGTIDKVQEHQKKINYDLDFVLQQQKELENALAPLEKEYASSNYHPDIQRERMYQTAETIDAQIKKMSEDVKETIEHVNETAPSQEKSHPILAIGRILNAHMNTLQWIDENSAELQSQIESLSRYLDNVKRENDRSYISYQ